MVVAVEERLVGLRRYLEQKGFEAVILGAAVKNIDAVVFESLGLNEFSEDFSAGAEEGHGVLMVYARGRSFGEVEKILTKRAYGELF